MLNFGGPRKLEWGSKMVEWNCVMLKEFWESGPKLKMKDAIISIMIYKITKLKAIISNNFIWDNFSQKLFKKHFTLLYKDISEMP